jgi:SAM-dependent methyltransferase
MRTFYEGHDRAYQVKRAKGEYGWTSPEVSSENFSRIRASFPEKVSSASRILDLGCGSGELSHYYATIAREVTGVDISPTAIAWAKEKFPDLHFICDSVMNSAALPMNHFDLAIDSNCLHCIIDNDRSSFLSNAFGWLRSGGLFVLHTMCNDPVGELLHGYDNRDRIIYHGDIATRYLGKADDILEEVDSVGFVHLQHVIHRQKEGPDMLVSLHQKEPPNKAHALNLQSLAPSASDAQRSTIK